MTGPLTGTPASSGHALVVGKSPLTGGWGDANCGGFFGPTLKFAGYDAVFFTGQPPPADLPAGRGRQGGASRRRHVWGMDTEETERRCAPGMAPMSHVACIGPAGEGSR